MNEIIKSAFINAILTASYIIIIASFMFSLQGDAPKADIVLIPVAMLMLFVFSAALTGFLVFGKPVMLYLDGKKKEAVSLISWTLGILFILVVIVFAVLMIYFNLLD